MNEAEPLTVLAGAFEEAEAALVGQSDTRERVDRVLDLAVGYESAYGLELLATVHWLATNRGSSNDEQLVQQVQDWSPRKARLFTEKHIVAALKTLRSYGWLAAPAV